MLWCPDTYDFARGLTLGSHSSPQSAAVVAQSGRRVLPFLDPSASPVGTAFLFLSPGLGAGGELSSSSSSSSWEECASESSNDESNTTLRRRPFQVPAAFFLVFFTGTL